MATKEQISKLLMEIRHLANSPISGSNVAQIVDIYHSDLHDIDTDLLNAAIAKLNKLRSHKGLTNKHLKIKVADIVELITEFLI